MKHLRIVTRNANTDEIDSEKVINHHDHHARVWLSNHIFWAVRNDMSVLLDPTNDPLTKRGE